MRAVLFILALLLTLAARTVSAQTAVVGSGGFGTTACSPNCTDICADYYVPQMGYGPNGVQDQTISIWPGVGAINAARIAQTGTLLTMLSSNGAVSFNTFWEQFPAAYTTDNSAGATKPFDHMHVCVDCATNCVANNAGTTWNFTVQDVTQNWTYTHDGTVGQSCLCDAEIFVEPQGGSQAYADLPRFGVVPVFNITVNGSAVTWATGNIYDWNARVFPSLIGADGQSGNICYGNNTAYTTAKCGAPPWAFGVGRGFGF